jgi:hypothetical protein
MYEVVQNHHCGDNDDRKCNHGHGEEILSKASQLLSRLAVGPDSAADDLHMLTPLPSVCLTVTLNWGRNGMKGQAVTNPERAFSQHQLRFAIYRQLIGAC